MSTEIVVPALGESVLEATVAQWLKQEGEAVQAGEVLVELETDKVNVEVGAERAGVLASILRKEGEDVKVGDVLGTIGETSDGQDSGQKSQPGKAQDQADTPQPEAARQRAEAGPEKGAVQSTPATPPQEMINLHGSADEGDGPVQAGREPGQAAHTPAAPADDRAATPVARRMAEQMGIDLAQVSGSAQGGRVTKEDIEAYVKEQASRKPSAPPAAAAAPPAASSPGSAPASAQEPHAQASDGRERRVRMSRRRRTIAQRLVEAQQTAAILTTFNEVDMSAVMDLRKRRNEAFQARYGVKVGFTSFFVKAAIGALKAFSQLNAEIQGDEIVFKEHYDIGIAVGASEGLVVPVIRDADRLAFFEIEKRINEFAEKAEKNTLTIEDLRGGTFTITNGGVFGSLLSTPILNPPQVGILGLHKIEPRPVAINNEIVIRPMMYVALSYDHRIVDGREAVQFLVRVKQLIEDPEVLLLEG